MTGVECIGGESGVMQKPLVIYHGNCQDGFGAAWACWIAHPDWEFYPARHGDPPPRVIGREVFLLDFSYKRAVIEEMCEVAHGITILDHHVTAQSELVHFKENPSLGVYVVFDMKKSGARLSWEWFHSTHAPMPRLLARVEDRDLWRFNFSDSRAVSAALFSYPYDFAIWTDLVGEYERNPTHLRQDGMAIDRRHCQVAAELVKALKRREVIGGTEVWSANLPYTMASDAAHLMCDGGEPFAACWYENATHRVYSLRSREGGADVSEIAELYGGGGHRHAAGFQVPLSLAGEARRELPGGVR